jgi:hypothetical protein
MPTTMLWLMTKGQWPQRVVMSAEKDSAKPDSAAPGQDDPQVDVGPAEKAGRIFGWPGYRNGEGEDAVQVEAGRRERGHPDDAGDQERAADDVELLAVEHVELDVQHGEPDPHGRNDLHHCEAPVGVQELHALEQHEEGTHDEGQRRQPAPALAELDHRLFHGLVVAPAVGPHATVEAQRRRARVSLNCHDGFIIWDGWGFHGNSILARHRARRESGSAKSAGITWGTVQHPPFGFLLW